MRIRFRPMPWLTVFTVMCLAILIGLGNWQYQRLQWKTNLLTEIDAAADAAPLTSIAESNELLENAKPLDFRRVSLSGEFVAPSLNNAQPFHLLMPDGKTLEWRLIQPFQTDSGLVYVATHKFPDRLKDNPPGPVSGPTLVNGYARLVRSTSRFVPDSNPATNSWYTFNGDPEALDWAGAVDGQTLPVAYYIDWQEGVTEAGDLSVKKPDVRNSHLDYMLTWYSFALILLVIYLILHRRAGRLHFKD